MMFFLAAMVLALGPVFACGAQELGGSLYSSLSWVPDGGFFVSADLEAELAIAGLDSGATLKFRKNEFSELDLDFTWYERPLRLAGKTRFKEGGFADGVLRARYWEDPWKVECAGRICAGEPPLLEFSGAFAGGVEAGWYLAFAGSLVESTLELALPLGEKGELSLVAKAKGKEAPWLSLKWKGRTPWGDLEVELRNLTLYSMELAKEWSEGKWEHELGLTVDVAGHTWELAQKTTFHWAEGSGYGFSFRFRQAAALELKRLHFFLFGPGWGLRAKAIARELTFSGEMAVGEDLVLGTEMYLEPEGAEFGLWLEGALGEGLEWTLGCDLVDGGVDEIYCELYLEA